MPFTSRPKVASIKALFLIASGIRLNSSMAFAREKSPYILRANSLTPLAVSLLSALKRLDILPANKGARRLMGASSTPNIAGISPKVTP